MIRLIRNLRYTPRARPVISQRRTLRVENFGVIFDLLTCAFVAIQSSFTFSIIFDHIRLRGTLQASFGRWLFLILALERESEFAQHESAYFRR